MARNRKTWQVVTLLLVLALLMAGCRTSPRPPVDRPPPTISAEQAFAQRDFVRAAEAWQRQALDADPAQAAGYRVRAADAWLLANRPEPARDLLKWISRDELSDADNARLDLVLADLALRDQRPMEANALLQNAVNRLPPSSRGRFDSLSQRTQAMLDRPAMQDISRATMLSDSISFYNPTTALDLLESLEEVPSGELAIRAENPRAERRLTGWLDLALVIRQNLVDGDRVEQAVSGWKSRYPTHPLTAADGLDLWLRYRQQFRPPRKVAVILPTEGRVSSAGMAIRDGLVSGFLDDPGGSEVVFFGTGDEPDSAISAYFSAVDAGASWIIGPLQREAIEAVLTLAGMTTPVLALNELPEQFSVPAGLEEQVFGISLSQEKEAASIADHAVEAGYQRAVVLAPESAWGERMVGAFLDDFLREDQHVVASARFADAETNYSPVIERVMKIDESKARKTQIENTLQMPVEFEPVRRSDVDVIFLAASSEQARLIRPQLRFHDAGDIPVYSTGRVYSGQPNPANNQDLNGIRFPIAPWQLTHAEREDIPDLSSIRGGNFGALYSVGRDAWRILPWLRLMRKDPDFVYAGFSGNYRSIGSHNLVREPAWAEFQRGRPVSLESQTTDPSDSLSP